MLLNSEQVSKHVINFDPKLLQQVSIDLRLKSVKQIWGGTVTKEGKKIQDYMDIHAYQIDFSPKSHIIGWRLGEGCYSITFEEDCIIPGNRTGMMLHRSTLVRMGGTLDCGIYDPGYRSVGGMGAVLNVGANVIINLEKGSSIATFYMFENHRVNPLKLYSGQYQEEKDFK